MRRKHYYTDVVKLGNVAVSRHAQERMDELNISQEAFEKALLEPVGQDVPDGHGILWRERGGVRIVIIEKPEPFKGAKLVKTVFGVQSQAVAKK